MAFIDIHGHYAWDIDDGMPSLEDAKKATYKYVHKESLKPISKDWYINTLQNNPEWLPDIAKYLVSTGNYQVLEKSWKEVQ